MQAMLGLVTEARHCHPDDESLQQWLYLKEVFGLDRLGRQEEAEAVVGEFFEGHTEGAREDLMADMYAWRFRFLTIRGELLGAVDAYKEGEQYLDATHEPWRLRGSAGLAYLKIGDFREARRLLHLIQQETAPHPKAFADHFYAALHLREQSGAEVLQPDSLLLALAALNRAEEAYRSFNEFGRVASINSERGWALTLLGEHREALNAFDQALTLAETYGVDRERIYGRFRRGQCYFAMGEYGHAKADLVRAIALMKEKDMREYESEIMLVFGDALAALDEHEEGVLVAYQQSLTAAEHSQNLSALRAGQLAGAKAIEVAMQRKGNTWGWIAIGGLLALFGSLGYAAITHIQRRQMQHGSVSDLRHETQYLPLFPQLVPPKAKPKVLEDTFDMRYRCIYYVIEMPALIMSLSEDEKLQWLASDPERIRYNSDVFKLAHFYECRYYGGDPNADAATLYRETFSESRADGKTVFKQRTGSEMPFGYWSWHRHYTRLLRPAEFFKMSPPRSQEGASFPSARVA